MKLTFRTSSKDRGNRAASRDHVDAKDIIQRLGLMAEHFGNVDYRLTVNRYGDDWTFTYVGKVEPVSGE